MTTLLFEFVATHIDGASCRVTRQQMLDAYIKCAGDREAKNGILRCGEWYFERLV